MFANQQADADGSHLRIIIHIQVASPTEPVTSSIRHAQPAQVVKGKIELS